MDFQEKPKFIEIPPEKQKELEERRKRPHPVGTGREFLEKRKELTLPAVEIKHTVFWVNPAFKETMPFRIEAAIGKPMKLGVFFTPTPGKYPKEKVRHPIIMPEEESRSGLVASVVFKDRAGNLYRDVDVKGMGFYEGGLGESGSHWVSPVAPKISPGEAYGLMDYELAIRDRNYSEKFVKAGIRTHRVLAMALLEEIIDERGEKISIEEAKKRGMVPQNMQPIIEARALGTKERIKYVRDDSGWRALRALRDAKAIVAQELGKDPEVYSWDKYLEWFAKTLGQQVARVRKLKLYHGYLTEHNITLDCRIVDLDSVVPVKEAVEEENENRRRGNKSRLDSAKLKEVDEVVMYHTDAGMAKSALRNLIIGIRKSVIELEATDLNYLNDLYSAAYEEELKPKKKLVTKEKI